MTVQNSVAESIDEVHRLYTQVLARSALQFERLPREYFLQLGERMPERARFFLWRNEGRLVACSVCLVHDGVLYDEYLGLDYSIALDWHLYFVTLRDLLAWAMQNGLREYRSAPLNYAPKRQLGFALAPLDLYVTHPSPALRAMLPLVLPLLAPTRAEPVLRRFPNADEL
jgi:predicted N-acyltransferase